MPKKFRAQDKSRIFDNLPRVGFIDKFGVKIMARLNFPRYYSKDKLVKIIDELEGSPLVEEFMVRHDCLRILEDS